jgi:SWI/SNF-related matrix-associated actin-dependent regulator of chromatin subfamily A-like protein 1
MKAELTTDNKIYIEMHWCLENLPIMQRLNAIRGYKTVPPGGTFPLSTEAIQLLTDLKFEIDEKLILFLEDSKKESQNIVDSKIEGLKGELFEYQKEGVAFLQRKNGRALLADDQGLGKSFQTLAYLQRNPLLRPAIVVCPASLKLNWKAEAEKWTNLKAEVVKGTKPYQTKAELIIINYDIVYEWVETLRKTDFKVLVLDEVTAVKESMARRTKAVKRLARGIPHVIALSGTPILNRPSEIYNAIQMISPGLFPSPKWFRERYCDMRYNGFGWTYSGATHIPELHQILINSVMIRRLKKDVLKDLPDKLFSFVPIEIDNESDYNKAESDFVSYIREFKGDEEALRAERAVQFAKIELLKQLSVKGKIQSAISWIKEILATDTKLVVFASHHFVIDTLMEQFKDVAVKLDGRNSAKEKDNSVKRFQNDDKVKLFIGNIKAAGVGLTLTAASNVAFMEYPWSPADLMQCSDRLHRIGQKDTVNVYYLHGSGTIEEKLIKILDRKKLILDSLLDGRDTSDEDLLTEILNQYS